MATLTKCIELSKLSKMSETNRQAVLGDLVQAATNPTEEDLVVQKQGLNKEISRFEHRYNMSSDEMKFQVSSGQLLETFEFCEWLMLLNIRSRFDRVKKSSHT